ncbi:GGDEF domain-containing protein [Roseateles sp. DAIF2]|uniref:GGDEF domain-containing protein n=1 Tax=Roseateles sp. DAIF2 TaxID=2714952 RepID=UPI0018A328B6|nr:GGDEF domain-containing protein [Roseateles sp. DAIF2]QPF75768.1 GGDEF domain-containing protein [Roseateles sp. DAIF2]
MHFDIATLFSLLVIQALALALLLPVLMGWRQASSGARHAQLAMGLQGAGWLALLATALAAERLLGTLAMGLISASLSALWLAMRDWLGPRRGRRLMLALPPLVALAYLAVYDSYALRVGGSNAVFGLQLLMICWMLSRPAKALLPELIRSSRRWRGLLLACLALLALLTLWRGALAAFDTSAYPSFYTPHPVNVLAAVLCNVAVTLSLAAILVAWRGETEGDFLRLTQSDALTGLPNRRAFTARAVDMISMARRYQEPLLLMSLDLDGFKALNEQHGHEVGDRALQLFARCLREQMRLGDLLGRLDGEEFAVLMARSDKQGPAAMDKRMRDALAVAAPRELGFPLGFSAGWAQLRHGDRNIEDLLRRADAALYEAKREGRGRLVAEPGAEQ